MDKSDYLDFNISITLLGKSLITPVTPQSSMPAKTSEQRAFLVDFAKAKFPDNNVNWQVATDSIKYADNPNHESYMPSFQEAVTRYSVFYDDMCSKPGLDLAKEEASLKTDLTKIFAAAKQ